MRRAQRVETLTQNKSSLDISKEAEASLIGSILSCTNKVYTPEGWTEFRGELVQERDRANYLRLYASCARSHCAWRMSPIARDRCEPTRSDTGI